MDENSQHIKARVRSVLRRCGWTIHVQLHKNGREYVRAARRDYTGKWKGAYIASLTKVDKMDDGQIKARLPDVA